MSQDLYCAKLSFRVSFVDYFSLLSFFKEVSKVLSSENFGAVGIRGLKVVFCGMNQSSLEILKGIYQKYKV